MKISMEKTRAMMEDAVSKGVFPSAVLLVGTSGEILYQKAFGLARPYEKGAAETGTFYDLASLTKPLATAACAMTLVEDGRLDLSATLSDLLPGVFGPDKAGVTVAQLLGHASGFAAHRKWYLKLQFLPAAHRRRKLLKLLVEEPLEYEPGTRTVYSDLGYMALLEVLERAAGLSLDRLMNEAVCEPLGISDLFYIPLESGLIPSFKRKREQILEGRSFAATEACPWRGRLLVGEVHDDNAWVTGGVAAHSGLFGTASEVWRLCAEMLSACYGKSETVFKRRTVEEFFTRKEGPGGFTLGFDTPTRPGSSSGRFFSDLTVGHLGFTGTSFWADIEKNVIAVLLSNRVHPDRSNEKIRAFRPLVHDSIMEELGLSA
ncbi:MAG: serine hydrolase [Deltaproteobacteria bacterium]|nr:serine hydrolase [Deltaproteobacteria bacterium]